MSKDETPSDGPMEHPGNEDAKEIRHPDVRIEHPGTDFEPKDINLSRIVALLVIGVCVVAAMYYGVWRLFWFQERVQEEVKQSPYPLAPSPSDRLPPEPRLEQLDRMPARESDAIRNATEDQSLADKNNALHRYGPTAEKGFVHIPIEQAMKTVAGSLPVDKGSSPGRDANGLLDAGQSNSGRMFQGASP